MAGYCKAYTHEEETKILNFIIDKKAYYKLRGVEIWREMEQNGELDRTYQSLKEHFRKKITPRLHTNYFPEVSGSELLKIKRGYEDTAIGSSYRKKQKKDDGGKGGKTGGVDLSVTPPDSSTDDE